MAQIRMDCASKPLAILFYGQKLRYLLADSKLADTALDAIGEDLIEYYKQLHFSAQKAIVAGADAYTIMKLMGHSSITVSQKYVHPSTETMGLAIRRMAGVESRQRSPTGLRLVKSQNG